MKTQEALTAVVAEVDELVKYGEQIIRVAARAEDVIPSDELKSVMTWVSRIGHVLQKVLPVDSTQVQLYQSALKVELFTYIHGNNYAHLVQIHCVLTAVQHQLSAGLLLDIRRLLQADIFVDFIDMAEHLLAEGFKDAAAVLAGGVLEDALRQLATGAGLPLHNTNGKPLTIEPLNVSLAKAGVYLALTQKQVTTWADVRNSAAHGHYGRYTVDDIKQMIQFVTRFCDQYLQ